MEKMVAVLIGYTAFVCSSLWAEVPKPMADNVFNLTEAAAVLNVCFESEEYKKLPTEKALKLRGLDIRLTNLVEKISKHYNDDSILLTYELMRVQLSSDPEMKEYVRKKYQCCGDKLLREMETYVSENEKVICDLLSTKKKRKRATPWPKVCQGCLC